MPKRCVFVLLTTFTFVLWEKLNESEPVKETYSDNQVALRSQGDVSVQLTGDDIKYLAYKIAETAYTEIPTTSTLAEYDSVWQRIADTPSPKLENKKNAIHTYLAGVQLISHNDEEILRDHVAYHSRKLFLNKQTCMPLFDSPPPASEAFFLLFKKIQTPIDKIIQKNVPMALTRMKAVFKNLYDHYLLLITLNQFIDGEIEKAVKLKVGDHIVPQDDEIITESYLRNIVSENSDIVQSLYKYDHTIGMTFTAIDIFMLCHFEKHIDKHIQKRRMKIYMEERGKLQRPPYVLFGVTGLAVFASLVAIVYYIVTSIQLMT